MRHILLILLLLLPPLLRAEPLRVFVSVPPQKTFVERVGGNNVKVRSMVQPGHSPHSYDPTPRQIGELSRADLYVRTGVPFENAWMGRIRSTNPKMQVLDARTGIDLKGMTDHGHGEHDRDDQHDDERDPHVWTSPLLVKQMARNIRDKLSEMAPGHTAEFARNYAAYAAELNALDRDLRTLFAPLAHRKFMVFHPAWGYFADRYGLQQIAIEHEGKEPGARALATLIGQARREGVKVIFVQPQFNKDYARQVARAINGRVVAIDPLAEDVIANLRQVAQQIAEAAQP